MVEVAGRRTSAHDLSHLEGLSELADPQRRKLYDAVVAAGESIRRDGAAEAAGVSRSLAAYHLDRLADAGLLTVSYKRPEGRSGPGAGRPAKHYARNHRDRHQCAAAQLSAARADPHRRHRRPSRA